eukprot:6480300-Amphidinium_carterae.1
MRRHMAQHLLTTQKRSHDNSLHAYAKGILKLEVAQQAQSLQKDARVTFYLGLQMSLAHIGVQTWATTWQ